MHLRVRVRADLGSLNGITAHSPKKEDIKDIESAGHISACRVCNLCCSETVGHLDEDVLSLFPSDGPVDLGVTVELATSSCAAQTLIIILWCRMSIQRKSSMQFREHGLSDAKQAASGRCREEERTLTPILQMLLPAADTAFMAPDMPASPSRLIFCSAGMAASASYSWLVLPCIDGIWSAAS